MQVNPLIHPQESEQVSGTCALQALTEHNWILKQKGKRIILYIQAGKILWGLKPEYLHPNDAICVQFVI